MQGERRASAECAAPNVLGRHLGALWANTKHRNPSDDPEVRKLATHRMVVMLMEYPERVALSAIDRWPQTEGGEWFPTEAELRGVCVAIQRAMRPAPPQPSSPAPEMPRSEREEMRAKMDAWAAFMKDGDPRGVPELIEAKRKTEADDAFARSHGYASFRDLVVWGKRR